MHRFVVKALAALGVLVFGISPVFADYPYPPRIPRGDGPIVIQDNDGGYVNEFLEWARRVGNSGRQVKVLGHCASACTAILYYVAKERICVSSNAEFWFHHEEDYPVLFNQYPQEIVEWLYQQGGRGFGEEFAVLKGRELLNIFRLCDS